jgi:NADPH-dependent 2,4-dienoyl-CoA reductase/sulfur reductase-like enzyme
MLRQAAKLMQGAQYWWSARAPMHWECWPVEARGEGALEEVILRTRTRRWTVACDFLACGFHLLPNTELAQLIGCRIEDGFVAVDDLQRTSVENVLCAGEPTGIGGVESALIEGQIAGLTAADALPHANKFVSRRRKLLGFVRALRETCALDPELRWLASDATIVCRCEDVSFGELRCRAGWRDAKLQTRCGMGPCQGRICGPAAEFLFGWRVESVRPPAFPVSVASLATAPKVSEEVQEVS